MKKLLVLVLILALTLTTAYAADPRYDTSGCDTETTEDGSVRVLGISGDPMPMTWGEFMPRFLSELEEAGFTGDFAFTTPVFSDGLWVRLMVLDNVLYVRAVTTSDGDDGLVVTLSAVSGKDDDTLSEYAKYIGACLYAAAARTENTFGETVIQLFHIDPALDIREYDITNTYWYQNGFHLYIGTKNDLYAVARIEYTGAYDKTPVAPLVGSPTLEPPIAEGTCDIDTFIKRAAPYFKMVFDAEPLKATSEIIDGRLMVIYVFGEEYITLYLNGTEEDSSIGHIMVMDLEGYPPNVFISGQIALFALTNMPEDAMNACGFINGENSMWNDLRELLPCAAYGGVRFCCVDMELSSEELHPMAILFGE